jgi:hypothetical protein
MRERRAAGIETYACLDATGKTKAIARGKASMAVHRGHLARQPCEVCGAEPAERHHEDYSQPLAVEWLCPEHHRERERVNRETLKAQPLAAA